MLTTVDLMPERGSTLELLRFTPTKQPDQQQQLMPRFKVHPLQPCAAITVTRHPQGV